MPASHAARTASTASASSRTALSSPMGAPPNLSCVTATPVPPISRVAARSIDSSLEGSVLDPGPLVAGLVPRRDRRLQRIVDPVELAVDRATRIRRQPQDEVDRLGRRVAPGLVDPLDPRPVAVGDGTQPGDL